MHLLLILVVQWLGVYYSIKRLLEFRDVIKLLINQFLMIIIPRLFGGGGPLHDYLDTDILTTYPGFVGFDLLALSWGLLIRFRIELT
jgi:hypothetical protein